MDVARKRLVIRKFQLRNGGNGYTFDGGWAKLAESVSNIQREEKTTVSCEELYSIVENLCRLNYGNEIYSNLQLLIREYVNSEAEKLIAATQHSDYHLFLDALNRFWEKFCAQMGMVRSIFLYLDRTYRTQNASVLSLWDSGLEAFRCYVLETGQIKGRIVKGLLHMIELERMGQQIDRQLLKSLLRMFMSLQIYDSSFESDFLKATERLYVVESRAKSQELEVGAYLRHVARRLREEEERTDFYLEPSTAKQLMHLTEQCFIANYTDHIIARGVDTLLDSNRVEDLSLMYSLLARVKNGLTALRTAFATYIKKVGKAMVMDLERDQSLVKDLMELKARLDSIIYSAFKDNDRYVQAEKDAFAYFINTRPQKPAELIAKYMDAKLRMGNKECSEEELDNVMDKVIVLFRFIQGKDVFEAYYKKDLAKRLLLGRSASVDAEKAMLSKLKNECGAGFTQKLEGMFKDVEISREVCGAFKQYLEGGDRERSMEKMEFSMSILTQGHWPPYPVMEVAIPRSLEQLQQAAATFYQLKYSGRKLQWQYTLASAIVKATFKPSVTKELDVSLFQAMILLLFNQKTEWSYPEIQASTKLDEAELKRTLQFRVIQKSPKGKDVASTDTFTFNEGFNDRLYRIRISQVQLKETEAEHRQTEQEIYQDRQYQIDAAVVRVMKMRKSLSHTLLMTELLNQLRFPTKPVDLKKRIESLIEREYMARDKDDAQLYHYVS